MNLKNLLRATTLACGLAAATSANAYVITFDDPTAVIQTVYFSQLSNGVTLTAEIDFDLTSISTTQAVFNVTVRNTTAVSTPGDNRLVSFGIDNVTPNLTSATGSNGWQATWSATGDANISNSYKVELCVWDGSNCTGGQNQGVAEASSESLTLTLNAANFGGETPSVSFDTFFARYQAIGANDGSDAFPSCEGPCGGGGKLPEPSTIALLGLGLAGMGYMRRRKSC